jgi:hypothetical protein
MFSALTQCTVLCTWHMHYSQQAYQNGGIISISMMKQFDFGAFMELS